MWSLCGSGKREKQCERDLGGEGRDRVRVLIKLVLVRELKFERLNEVRNS